MYFYTPEERESKVLFDGITARTFWGDKILMSLVDLPANSVVPLHSHPHEQTGMVLEGELTFTVGGETKTLGPGDMYVIPGDVEHKGVAGDAPVKVLDVFSPVREDYKY